MKIVNLTGYDIVFDAYGDTIRDVYDMNISAPVLFKDEREKSLTVRIKTVPHHILKSLPIFDLPIEGEAVSIVREDGSQDIPPKRDDVIYIVTEEVARYMRRPDFIFPKNNDLPATPDEDGNIHADSFSFYINIK